jgi:hypothetical protein
MRKNKEGKKGTVDHIWGFERFALSSIPIHPRLIQIWGLFPKLGYRKTTEESNE